MMTITENSVHTPEPLGGHEARNNPISITPLHPSGNEMAALRHPPRTMNFAAFMGLSCASVATVAINGQPGKAQVFKTNADLNTHQQLGQNHLYTPGSVAPTVALTVSFPNVPGAPVREANGVVTHTNQVATAAHLFYWNGVDYSSQAVITVSTGANKYTNPGIVAQGANVNIHPEFQNSPNAPTGPYNSLDLAKFTINTTLDVTPLTSAHVASVSGGNTIQLASFSPMAYVNEQPTMTGDVWGWNMRASSFPAPDANSTYYKMASWNSSLINPPNAGNGISGSSGGGVYIDDDFAGFINFGAGGTSGVGYTGYTFAENATTLEFITTPVQPVPEPGLIGAVAAAALFHKKLVAGAKKFVNRFF